MKKKKKKHDTDYVRLGLDSELLQVLQHLNLPAERAKIGNMKTRFLCIIESVAMCHCG